MSDYDIQRDDFLVLYQLLAAGNIVFCSHTECEVCAACEKMPGIAKRYSLFDYVAKVHGVFEHEAWLCDGKVCVVLV